MLPINPNGGYCFICDKHRIRGMSYVDTMYNTANMKRNLRDEIITVCFKNIVHSVFTYVYSWWDIYIISMNGYRTSCYKVYTFSQTKITKRKKYVIHNISFIYPLYVKS
jgi:hypothetical protein